MRVRVYHRKFDHNTRKKKNKRGLAHHRRLKSSVSNNIMVRPKPGIASYVKEITVYSGIQVQLHEYQRSTIAEERWLLQGSVNFPKSIQDNCAENDAGSYIASWNVAGCASPLRVLPLYV